MKIETKGGLWVSNSFTEKFGNKEIIPAKTVPTFKTLERAMNDSEIKNELGAQECTLEDLAAFLENPPTITQDGYWNIFYVAGYVVDVRWFGDDREWYVHTWSLDDGYWLAGSRAFSRNWHSEPLKSESSLSLESLATRVEKLENILEEVRNVLKTTP